jgi:hypothetical protein
MKKRLLTAAILLLTVTSAASEVGAQRARNRRSGVPALIWQPPGDMRSRDLRYGPGSARLAPVAPFRFLKEDKDGESPKFKVKDARNVEWSVKLGPESQSETVASRIVWAAGYFAEEAYYYERVRIEDLPRLSRGREYVDARGTVRGARFEPRRATVERGDTWDWGDNPFEGTRQLNGLKVLMILLNNYDARENNNHVLRVYNPARKRHEARYVVTDLGATLGRAGGLGGTRSKNNLKDFLSTGFVLGTEDGAVTFDYDTRPSKLGTLSVLYPPYYFGEVKKEKSMRGIPIAHARWIGSLLSQLSDRQLRQAFHAADYDPSTTEAYVRALRQRINQLRRL